MGKERKKGLLNWDEIRRRLKSVISPGGDQLKLGGWEAGGRFERGGACASSALNGVGALPSCVAFVRLCREPGFWGVRRSSLTIPGGAVRLVEPAL